MARVELERHFVCGARELAERCAQFDSFGVWHPAFAPVEVEDREEGRVRTLSFGDALVRELLTWEGELGYAWRALEHPLPFEELESRIVVEARDGGGAEVHWTTHFELSAPLPAEPIGRLLHGLMTMGMDTIERDLAAPPPPPAPAVPPLPDVDFDDEGLGFDDPTIRDEP